jgi:FMN phosphatase YigB (HAD superfamily)
VTRTARDRVIIFDFDGTITVGDGPVLAYAEQVATRLAPGLADGFRAAVTAGLHGRTGTVTTLTTDAIDDYDLVRQVAVTHGADASVLSASYLASRELLATEHAVIWAPPLTPPSGTRTPGRDDLASWLRRLSTRAYLVLATNAPATGLDRALAVLGVTDAFDEVRTSVGKPAGMHALADEMLARGPVLSVGDVWHNDLEPVWARGGATALLTRGRVGDARATYRADTLDGLVPGITAWADATAEPHQLHHAHPVPHLTTTAKADL